MQPTTIAGVRLAMAALAFALCSRAGAAVWPGEDWAVAPPESRGMSSAGLAQAAEYALKHGGGSGCVIRHGYLVKEWGDPKKLHDIKSATKGSVGATLLGLAVDDGLVGLDDRAQKHYPAIGTEKAGNRGDWLVEITVRHLATMTAGFDDGRPPALVRRPGTGGEYSNDTSNMLAELLTLRFREDLREVFARRVMQVIGAPGTEWAWRQNAYRPRTIGDWRSREFASGLTITHRALARLGYLYLRQGEWDGRRVLSREFIRTATEPTTLPSFVPYYAFYWGSNGRRTYAGMPPDTFWALGLGDSFVVVCPSLDLVAVRLGVGSNASRLPGDPGDNNWGKRVEGFFGLVVNAVQPSAGGDAGTRPPYPPSRVIGLDWAPQETIVRRAKGSDNWPLTWADDDALYGAYGDGNGFAPFVPEKLSLGFAKITGGPADFAGRNVRSATGETRGDGPNGKKASGLLCVDGVLYLWARNATNAQLAWSGDHGRTWTWADWRFTESFGCPTFLNFGRNYAGAPDHFVYVYSPDAPSAYQTADQLILARAPKDRLRERAAYEFFAGIDDGGRPVWAGDISRRGAAFVHSGRCYRTSVTFNAGLKRYLLVQPVPRGSADAGREAARLDTRFQGGLAIFEAPEPWGPWSTVFYTDAWDVGPGDSASFPSKWMSEDGRKLHLVFSGDDCFSVRGAGSIANSR